MPRGIPTSHPPDFGAFLTGYQQPVRLAIFARQDAHRRPRSDQRRRDRLAGGDIPKLTLLVRQGDEFAQEQIGVRNEAGTVIGRRRFLAQLCPARIRKVFADLAPASEPVKIILMATRRLSRC